MRVDNVLEARCETRPRLTNGWLTELLLDGLMRCVGGRKLELWARRMATPAHRYPGISGGIQNGRLGWAVCSSLLSLLPLFSRFRRPRMLVVDKYPCASPRGKRNVDSLDVEKKAMRGGEEGGGRRKSMGQRANESRATGQLGDIQGSGRPGSAPHLMVSQDQVLFYSDIDRGWRIGRQGAGGRHLSLALEPSPPTRALWARCSSSSSAADELVRLPVSEKAAGGSESGMASCRAVQGTGRHAEGF
ncbi:hypothetical protein K456DRAFT_1058203 [Colletotrichum gloeosporioides 23]|nr:hypothetical protein K456DRAFT_1058203 [Colletotrichum gloeosporioides 23]